MSSALQSVLSSLQRNDYVSLAVLTAVGYDYVLTFSDEIEYIWTKSWTAVSTLFILVRYAGLCAVIINCLGQIMYIIAGWAFLLFLGAADLMMILRVWAMYNRSRLILKTLLTLFSLEIISTLLDVAIYSDSRNVSVYTIHILDFTFCVWQPISPIWMEVATILQITHGIPICILAIAQFVGQSLQMYRVTKDWQLNRYMNLLVKQGILYFLGIFLNCLIQVLSVSGNLPIGGWQMDLLMILEYVPMFTLTPRLILSIRELYAHDVRVRRGEGIDTGFGLSASGRGVVGTEIVFSDVEPKEGSEDDVQGGGGDEIDIGSSSSGRGAVGTAMVFEDVEPNVGLEDIEQMPRDAAATGQNG